MPHRYCQIEMRSARIPQEISASPRYRGACGRTAARAPGVSSKCSRYWTIAKPKPISATAVRSHDIIVRSRLRRVRTQAKWLSAVTLTSNLPVLGAVRVSAMECPLSLPELGSHDTAEANMAHAGVDRLGVPRRRAIAPAVIRRAKMRAAFDDFARYAHGRTAFVVAAGLGPAAGILRDAAGLRQIRTVPGREPIRGPFPNVADHVVDAVAVRWERGHR